MKNNAGFTLIQALLITALLSIIAGIGMSVATYNAKRMNSNQRSNEANLLIKNITTTAANEGALKKTEGLQFDSSLPTPTPP